jgi:hypothetical protein
MARFISEKCRDAQRAAVTKHGQRRTRLANIWHGMKSRCENPKSKDYSTYGGRGITICNEWRDDFLVFKTWATANGYDSTLSIDRIDDSLGYCPSNCRFIPIPDNCARTRRSLALDAFGETKSIREWVSDYRCSVSHNIVYHRIKNLGWLPERAISSPLHYREVR